LWRIEEVGNCRKEINRASFGEGRNMSKGKFLSFSFN
jgi:hypothetical protein